MQPNKYSDLIVQIKQVYASIGYTEDRFGNMKRTITVNGEPREYRIKFNPTSFRKESKYVDDYKAIHWFKVGGHYYKDVNVVNNKLSLRK